MVDSQGVAGLIGTIRRIRLIGLIKQRPRHPLLEYPSIK